LRVRASPGAQETREQVIDLWWTHKVGHFLG
jgi:hypothetical protein